MIGRIELRAQLARQQPRTGHKIESAGKWLVLVGPRSTTKTCSRCGNLNPRPGTDSVYRCDLCSLTMDKDENASVNILHATLEAVGVKRDRNLKLFECGTPVVITKKSRQARSPVVRLRVPPDLKTQALPIG